MPENISGDDLICLTVVVCGTIIAVVALIKGFNIFD